MLINELRNINLIIFPDWSNLETAIAEDLTNVLRTLFTHPARQDITLLVDTQNLSDELQDNANSLLFETVLKLSLEEVVCADFSR